MDLTVALFLGTHGDPRGVGVSYGRGIPAAAVFRGGDEVERCLLFILAFFGSNDLGLRGRQPETLNPQPYTLHPTPYTLHPTPVVCVRRPASTRVTRGQAGGVAEPLLRINLENPRNFHARSCRDGA